MMSARQCGLPNAECGMKVDGWRLAAGGWWLAAVIVVWAAGRSLAVEPPSREAAVQEIVAALKAEVARLSPALGDRVDWRRLAVSLGHAGRQPEMWLGRSTLLAQVYNLADWPMDQKLALLREYYKDASPIVRRLVVDLLAREDAAKAGSLADLRRVVKDDPDAAVKIEAAQRLLERGDPAGWEPLLALLTSDDPALRQTGAVKVGPCRDAKEALIDLSLNYWRFGSNDARLPASVRLSPAMADLATRAFVMNDNVIRRTVVELIALNRDRAHFALLKERVEKEEAWTVLRSLYIGLGYLGDPRAIPFLKAGVEKQKVARVGRTTPSLGLAFLGDVAGLRALVDAVEEGEHLPVLAKALSRAFDPDFDEETGLFLVPDASGRMAPSWIPSASTRSAPMVADEEGAKARAPALTAAQVHAAWDAFLKVYGARLVWDQAACRFTLGPASPRGE